MCPQLHQRVTVLIRVDGNDGNNHIHRFHANATVFLGKKREKENKERTLKASNIALLSPGCSRIHAADESLNECRMYLFVRMAITQMSA